ADETIKDLPNVKQKHSDNMYTSRFISMRKITEGPSKLVFGSKSLDFVI
ncbi:5701_t:CDS:1, partial [Dentiscutata erythropus]